MKRASKSDLSLFAAAKPVRFGTVKVQLAQARVFIAKCVRDLPAVVAKTGLRPTPADRSRINLEAARAALGADLIIQMCERKKFGLAKRPDRNGRDRLGVGQRYSAWLDPLVDAVPVPAKYTKPARTFASAFRTNAFNP